MKSGSILSRKARRANPEPPHPTSNSLAVYYKVVAIAGEPSSHVWGVAGGAFLVGGIQSFSGVDGANPIDAESGQSTASSTNHDTPSITTSTANTMLVTSHTYASSRSWTPQAGLTESFERLSGAASATGQSITGTRQTQAAAGASGTKRSTAASSADVGNTHILALRQLQVQVQALHFIHVDHLNTPRLVANAAGTSVWRWDQQEPFGVSVADENPSGLGAFEFPLRFPGQYADNESGLFFNDLRHYDSGLGRYVQSDPIGLEGGLNSYVYVDSDPLVTIDPDGLSKQRGGGNPRGILGPAQSSSWLGQQGAWFRGQFYPRLGPSTTNTISCPAPRAAQTLPTDLPSTLNRVSSGGTFPHRNDGALFRNDQGLLPRQPSDYYREYVHPTPGVAGAGVQRVVTGQGGEIYYSPNHYQSFVRIK